jgi:hypothetical protein
LSHLCGHPTEDRSGLRLGGVTVVTFQGSPDVLET